MWLSLSLEWELDFPGVFRDKTLGDGFKLSVCIIACGVLEQHKDVSRCCVVMSHAGHPLTLYTSAGGGWHGKHILPGARPGTLLELKHFCLPLSSPAWCRKCCAEMAAGGSPEPSEGLAAWFWKNTLPEVFSCEILLLRMMCICTHITTNGHRKSQDILSEKIDGLFWDSRSLRFSCFVAQRRWHLPISSYWQPQNLFLPSPSPHQVSRVSFFHCSCWWDKLLTYPRITKSVPLLTEAGT